MIALVFSKEISILVHKVFKCNTMLIDNIRTIVLIKTVH